MGQKYQVKLTKLNWQQNLDAVAITRRVRFAIGYVIPLAFMGMIESSAQAIPTQKTFQLAQVGVRSEINAPASLNITPPPRTHIPLPESNYDEQDLLEDSIYYRDSDYYQRYESNDDDYYYHHEHHTHRHKEKKGGSIIIINLPSENYYDSNEKTYIRVNY
jgi:hypothetical protein